MTGNQKTVLVLLIAAIFLAVSYLTNHYTNSTIILEARKSLKQDSASFAQLVEYCDTAGGGKIKSFSLYRSPKLDSLEFGFEDENARSHYSKRELKGWMETFRFGNLGFTISADRGVLTLNFKHSNYRLRQSLLIRATNLDSLVRFTYPNHQVVEQAKQISDDKWLVILDKYWCLVIR